VISHSPLRKGGRRWHASRKPWRDDLIDLGLLLVDQLLGLERLIDQSAGPLEVLHRGDQSGFVLLLLGLLKYEQLTTVPRGARDWIFGEKSAQFNWRWRQFCVSRSTLGGQRDRHDADVNSSFDVD
jgi:hypothetical protein